MQKRSLSQDDENDVKRRCGRCEERERWMAYLDEPFGDAGGLMNLEVIHFSLKTWRVMRAIFILDRKKYRPSI